MTDNAETLPGDLIDKRLSKLPPETRLYRAVIAQAWQDAFILSDASLSNIDRTAEPAAVRSVARNWLVSDLEPWRDDREEICAAADIDADALRDAARRRIALARADDAERDEQAQRKVRERLDAMLANLLGQANRLSRRHLDHKLAQIAEIEAATV